MSRRLWIAGIIPTLVLGIVIASALASSPADEKETSLGRSGTSPTVVDSRAALDVPLALAGSEPLFVSDYFSFVGTDEKGRVAFAIDNDRSRQGLKFTADAHVVLHDEQEGWIKVSGGGDYENKKKKLLPIPDSPDFQFLGEVKTGITLVSPNNQLQLTIDPMQEQVSRIDNQSIYSMGSTSATLKWKDRVIFGRVIYEYLFMKNLSPWYSFFSGLFFNDFQGLYLNTPDGGDFYLHTSKDNSWSKTTGQVLGFQVLDLHKEILEDLQVEVPERSFSFGFYRWPKRWLISWRGDQGSGSLSLRVVDQKTMTNWLIGGFAMAVVSGEISYGGKTRPVYGLAELIR